MTALILRNLLPYGAQLGILIAIAGCLAMALKLTPRVRLHCFQVLLGVCLLLPMAQPWRVPPPLSAAVTFSSIPLGYASHPTPPPAWRPSIEEVALAIVAAGALVRLAFFALGLFRLRRYLDRGRFVLDAFAIEKQRTGVAPDVFASAELRGPVTFGLFRPAIVVPERWIDSESIAYHELLHVRRRDWIFTIVEELVRAVFWFHPAIWWLIGRIQLTREEVVDREVVRLMESREQYLNTLLAIAAAKAGLDLAPAPLFLKKRHLRQRVTALLKEVTMSKARTRSSLAALAAGAALAGWMAIHSFPLQAAPQQKDAAGVTVRQDESKLLHRSPVRYPIDAQRAGIQGTVLVEATLDSNGEVTDAQVMSGPQELRRAAIESVLQWHYDRSAGLPPKIQIAIEFTLPSEAAAAPVVRERAQTLQAVLTPLPPEGATLQRIALDNLSDSLRSRVSALLPARLGDRITPAMFTEFRAALTALDPHLTTAVGITRENDGVTLTVSLATAVDPGSPQRIRVGGNAAQVNLIQKVTPVYPPLAKQARIQGTVRFTATIGKDGRIMNLQLISGHPLLVDAAQEAVKQWVYRPTLLNGDPVEVITQIDVNFTLLDDGPAQQPPPGQAN